MRLEDTTIVTEATKGITTTIAETTIGLTKGDTTEDMGTGVFKEIVMVDARSIAVTMTTIVEMIEGPTPTPTLTPPSRRNKTGDSPTPLASTRRSTSKDRPSIENSRNKNDARSKKRKKRPKKRPKRQSERRSETRNARKRRSEKKRERNAKKSVVVPEHESDDTDPTVAIAVPAVAVVAVKATADHLLLHRRDPIHLTRRTAAALRGPLPTADPRDRCPPIAVGRHVPCLRNDLPRNNPSAVPREITAQKIESKSNPANEIEAIAERRKAVREVVPEAVPEAGLQRKAGSRRRQRRNHQRKLEKPIVTRLPNRNRRNPHPRTPNQNRIERKSPQNPLREIALDPARKPPDETSVLAETLRRDRAPCRLRPLVVEDGGVRAEVHRPPEAEAEAVRLGVDRLPVAGVVRVPIREAGLDLGLARLVMVLIFIPIRSNIVSTWFYI